MVAGQVHGLCCGGLPLAVTPNNVPTMTVLLFVLCSCCMGRPMN